MDTSESKKSMKRKRDAETSHPAAESSSSSSAATARTVTMPVLNLPSQDGSQGRDQIMATPAESENWIPVKSKKNRSPFKIPKTTANTEDLRTRLTLKHHQQPPQNNSNDLRQQLQRHQHQQHHQFPASYASTVGKNQHSSPQAQAPWGPLELRVFCTKFRHAPMSQQAWTELHLTIMEIVQNEVETEDADADDLAVIEAKKMCIRTKLKRKMLMQMT